MKLIASLLLALACVAPAVAGQQQHPTHFTYYSVTNPAGPTYITGLNNLGKISGYTGSASAYTAFTSEAPYAKYHNVGYPGAVSSQALALSNTHQVSGQYQDATGTHGYIRTNDNTVHNQYVSYPQPVLGVNSIKCGGGDCHKKQNWNPGNPLAVGPQGSGGYVTDTVTGDTTNLIFPAVGINGKGHVIGNYSGGIYVYHYVDPWYHQIPLVGYSAIGINWQGDIVGSFVGPDGITHGFLLYPKEAPIQLDEPDATCGTWATSMNQHDNIAGYYCNATGAHGFLAVPQS